MKKESAVFVRVPIMAFGILLLICNCALAQKELVIEYTAESERMRCTIEEYVQNGDEIKYSVQDEPADIQIMTYKQMQKAAENGDILPIEIDDVSSTVKFGDDVYQGELNRLTKGANAERYPLPFAIERRIR